MSEWRFKRDTAFRKLFFVPDSFSHPAKMDSQLLIKIVETYTQPGETILDPMAGSGTTMLACGLGRNCILVELEEKFCKMCRDNWEQVKMRPQLGYSMGNCQIIQGDARQLENILESLTDVYNSIDKIITSPPFQAQKSGGTQGTGKYSGTDLSQGLKRVKDDYSQPENPNSIDKLPYGQLEGLVDKIVTSPPYAEALDRDEHKHPDGRVADMLSRSYLKSSHGKSEGQIGNLPYGQIDKIVTSPPYSDISMGGGLNTKPPREGHNDQSGRSPDSPSQRGLVDKIVTSPPYSEGLGHKHRKYGRDIEVSKSIQAPEYSRSPNNIGNLPYGQIDKIVTSPPYENQVHGGTTLEVQSGSPSEVGQLMPDGYSEDKSNIGNLKSSSYLEAMLQVYQQCYKVLKPQGLMILVTKDFIRNKKRVDLAGDTIKLCEQAGFSFVERHYRKLPSQSFWRVIYHQKHPEVEQINYEDVLVFRKSY